MSTNKWVPFEQLMQIFEWERKRRELGGLKMAIARWRDARQALGSAADLAKALGLSRELVYQILSRKRKQVLYESKRKAVARKYHKAAPTAVYSAPTQRQSGLDRQLAAGEYERQHRPPMRVVRDTQERVRGQADLRDTVG